MSRAQVEAEIAEALTVPLMPWVVGQRYDGTASFGGSIATVALAASTLYAVPIIPVSLTRVVGSAVAIDALGIEVTAGGGASTKARLGLYAIGVNGKPGALILDAGEVNVDAIAAVAAVVAHSLACGVPIFRAIVTDGTPTVRTELLGVQSGATTTTDTQLRAGWSAALAYTAGVTVLPVAFPASSALAAMPRIQLKAA